MALENLLTLLKNLIIFSSYMTEKSSFPKPLSKEKEQEYLKKSASGDKEAKEILVKHNLRLVAHIAKKYANYGDNDELISIGSIMDMLESDQNVIEDVENSIMMEKLSQITKSALDEREYQIIKLRYGLENTGALTQREVAKKFNISRSYVSRIEKKALEKIKKSVNKDDLM